MSDKIFYLGPLPGAHRADGPFLSGQAEREGGAAAPSLAPAAEPFHRFPQGSGLCRPAGPAHGVVATHQLRHRFWRVS